MKTWVRRSLNVGALTAGALLVSGAAAQAAPVMHSSDNVGLLNGTQALVPVQAPVNVCGNAIGVLGTAAAECVGGASALNPEWTFGHFQTSGNVGAGNGTQLYAPVQAPVNVCGNAVGVLGSAAAQCEGGADAEHGKQPEQSDKPGYGKGGHGKGGHGKGGYGKGGYGKGGHGKGGHGKGGHGKPGYGYGKGGSGSGSGGSGSGGSGSGDDDASGIQMITTGNVGILNGTQALVPVQVPINVCGNAVALLGTAQAGCEGGATAILP